MTTDFPVVDVSLLTVDEAASYIAHLQDQLHSVREQHTDALELMREREEKEEKQKALAELEKFKKTAAYRKWVKEVHEVIAEHKELDGSKLTFEMLVPVKFTCSDLSGERRRKVRL